MSTMIACGEKCTNHSFAEFTLAAGLSYNATCHSLQNGASQWKT